MMPPESNPSVSASGSPASTERPGNRPPGAPLQAGIAGGAFFLGAGLTFVELVYSAALLSGVGDGDVTFPAWIVLSILMLTIGIGVGSGKRWTIRLFRWLSFGAIALYLPLLALALYLNAGPTPIDTGLAWVMFAFAVVKLPCFVILYRSLRQLRWLDPDSLPHEWEPPFRQR
jgi:hypothetical protein